MKKVENRIRVQRTDSSGLGASARNARSGHGNTTSRSTNSGVGSSATAKS